MLQGLWKLNPANKEPIISLSDYPRDKFARYDADGDENPFIIADFELSEEQIQEMDGEAFAVIRFSRQYDGTYSCWGLNEKSEPKHFIEEEEFDSYFEKLPQFVYFSDYGNLDSEIYLPHVIANADRQDIGESQRAKARTLDVLFKYVKLKPKDILALGQETPTQKVDHYGHVTQNKPTQEQIDKDKENKKKREVLLTSASTQLTRSFREWWKQGDYRFRFQADGNHFRIWVSDDRRPVEVELEGRSRGLGVALE